jgi:hypothetical protein
MRWPATSAHSSPGLRQGPEAPGGRERQSSRPSRCPHRLGSWRKLTPPPLDRLLRGGRPVRHRAADGIPRRPDRESVAEFPDNVALEFFGRETSLLPSSATRSAAPPRGCASSGCARATRSRSSCRTARSTSPRSNAILRLGADRHRAQPALHPARSCATSSRTTAPRSSSAGTRSSPSCRASPRTSPSTTSSAST